MRSSILRFASFNFTSRQAGIFYTLLSGLLFGLLGYFGMSLINAQLSVYNTQFWRFLLSAICLSLMLLPSLNKTCIAKIELFKLFLCGSFFYSSCAIFYFQASKHIGSGLAMIIFYTYPVMVMITNKMVFRISISKLYYPVLLMIGCGLILLTHGSINGNLDLSGILFSLIAAFLYALYIICGKKSPVPALPASLMLCLGCLPTCFFAAWLEQSFSVPNGFHNWINLLGLSILCTALPIMCLLKGLQYLNTVQASILSVLEPIFVLLFGMLLLGEQINLIQMAGVIVLLGGAFLSLLF
ncbi:hypothetical protein B1207_08890 [Legionella quinlivanii]|uniref:EamA domain-containing protein n=1 Tax=Legionella quinlivanii TaxID=45073 RepID=A0A364LIK8_9GAMM|nr:DMT family transporter [Legionella quinlivanii]RAP36253.1 hypothetical protein B1207_08890 [Legionella quinlivanii]